MEEKKNGKTSSKIYGIYRHTIPAIHYKENIYKKQFEKDGGNKNNFSFKIKQNLFRVNINKNDFLINDNENHTLRPQ